MQTESYKTKSKNTTSFVWLELIYPAQGEHVCYNLLNPPDMNTFNAGARPLWVYNPDLSPIEN